MPSRSSLPELMRMCGGACLGGGDEVSESMVGGGAEGDRGMRVVLFLPPSSVKETCRACFGSWGCSQAKVISSAQEDQPWQALRR